MIAVIERAECAVWGVGVDSQQAMADAKCEIAKKQNMKIGRLECVPLSDKAPLELDGMTLYEYCSLDQQDEAQASLF